MNRFTRIFICLSGGLIVALVLGWLYLASGPAFFARERQDGWSYHSGMIMPGQSVGQTFICRLPNLSRIDVKLGTYGRPVVKPVTLHLLEIDEPRPKERSRPMPAGDGGVKLEVFEGRQVGQSFIARLDGLIGVRILIDGRRLPAAAQVRFQVRTWKRNGPGRVLAAAWVAADKLAVNGFKLFEFKPLDGVKGRRLVFTLDVIGAPRGQGLAVRFAPKASSGDLYRDGSAFILERDGPGKSAKARRKRGIEPGDIIFRPAYSPRLPSGPDLRRVVATGFGLIDNAFNSFVFEPLADSEDKNYYFYLTVGPGSGVGPTALVDSADRYPYGTLVYDGVPSTGGLAFRAYFQVDRRTAADHLITKATKNRPRPWSLRWLIPVLALAHLVLLGLVLGGVMIGRRR